MISPTQTATAARCGHFGTCGGCSIQDLSYEDQLQKKRLRVESALSCVGAAVSQVHPSPEIWFYRNKMEFSFGDVYPPIAGGPSLLLGLKPKGRWYEILDLKECYLLSPEIKDLLAEVRRWAQGEKLLPYNSHKHNGFLRHLVVREAKNAKERLINLVTDKGVFPAASFLQAIGGVYPATTVIRGLNAKVSDTAVADSFEVISGSGYITEVLRLEGRELKFRISPNSFFQTNTHGAEILYGIVRRWVANLKPEKALDLYCGGGGISLSCADLCGKMFGVEISRSAIEDGGVNAKLNDISNVQFYAGQVEALLPSLLDMRPGVVVTDPPRAGLVPKVAQALSDFGPQALIYVSCNPEALGRDLKVLESHYRVERAEVVDLFPHTEHVETAVMLRRI